VISLHRTRSISVSSILLLFVTECVGFSFNNVCQGTCRLVTVCWFAQALFSSEKISDFGTEAFSFLFNKYYPIID